MIEAVIFDLDGTLFDIPLDYEKLLHEFSIIMKTNEVRPVTKTVARLDERTKKRVFKVWDDAEATVWRKGRIKDNGMALYTKYFSKPKALVTMQGKAVVKDITKSLRIGFDAVITREDSLDRTEQVKTAAGKLHVPTKNLLFVGNTEGDAEAAENVQCKYLKVE